MKKAIGSILAMSAIFLATQASAQVFYADLSPANEVPPLKTGMGGLAVASVTVNEDGSSSALIIMSAFGNDTPITASHVHIGAAGVAGPVICPLTEAEFTNPVIGNCNFTIDQTTELLNGNLYVNVHTEAHRGGEVRGQLFPAK